MAAVRLPGAVRAARGTGAGARRHPARAHRNGSPPSVAEQVRDELREFTRLGGFGFTPGSTPWFGAPLRSREQARAAIDLAVTLDSRTLPAAIARLAAACRDLGLPAR